MIRKIRWYHQRRQRYHDPFRFTRVACIEVRKGIKRVKLHMVSSHPTVANYFTVDLAVLKELPQELAKLFGFTLPFSLNG